MPAEGEGLIKEVRGRTEARGLLSQLFCHHCHNAGRKFSKDERDVGGEGGVRGRGLPTGPSGLHFD